MKQKPKSGFVHISEVGKGKSMLRYLNTLSLCPGCFCMTYTIKGKCGKCKTRKTEEKK